MFASMEMRWFLGGEPPQSVRTWLDDPRFSVNSEAAQRNGGGRRRFDRYLLLPQVDSLSIKLRDGKTAEIKRRVADHGVHEISHHMIGRMTQWYAWTFDLARVEAVRWRREPHDQYWVVVQKKRWRRKFEIGPHARVTPVDPNRTNLTQACVIEVSALTLRGHTWWSLGFEAFGDSPYNTELALRETLDSALSFSQRVSLPVRLGEQASLNYSAWLSLHSADRPNI